MTKTAARLSELDRLVESEKVQLRNFADLKAQVADIALVITEYMKDAEPAPERRCCIRCSKVALQGHPYCLDCSKVEADAVNHPKHYTLGVEVIDAIEAWKLGYHLGNCVKYIARADHKGSRLEDLKKAKWYLERAIAREEKP
jgi:hypothetical protein